MAPDGFTIVFPFVVNGSCVGVVELVGKKVVEENFRTKTLFYQWRFGVAYASFGA